MRTTAAYFASHFALLRVRARDYFRGKSEGARGDDRLSRKEIAGVELWRHTPRFIKAGGLFLEILLRPCGKLHAAL